jgi:protein-L-isoaspartate(D-aspartate) O-methyltransferase
MNIETARFNMIEQQIRPWEVLDPRAVAAGHRAARGLRAAGLRALAFVDTQVPLLPGQPDGPRMLEPRVEARLLQELKVQRHEKVLEIGTGSGFMAALLAHRAQQVVTLECGPSWPHGAREPAPQRPAERAACEVSAADGARGLPAEAPFDAIVLSGSVAEVPRVLLEQLKVGGRLVPSSATSRSCAPPSSPASARPPGRSRRRLRHRGAAPEGFAEKPAFHF